jgi:hypothetical protein
VKPLLPIFLLALLGISQPTAAPLTRAQQAGRDLATTVLSQKPSEGVSSSGIFTTRDSHGRRRQIPFRFSIVPGETNWQSIYEVLNPNQNVMERVTIIHAVGLPNRYLLARSGAGQTLGDPITLTGDVANLPFAGTDFWLSDLGLEFFHWPEQRVDRDDMRHGLSCKVLESLNPQPSGGGYSRVVSWIPINDHQPSGVLRAKGYDQNQNLLKEFNFRTVKKVAGRWQLKELEILNVQNDSRTRLEFDLEVRADRPLRQRMGTSDSPLGG